MSKKINEDDIKLKLNQNFAMSDEDAARIIDFSKNYSGSLNSIVKHLDYLHTKPTELCPNLVDRYLTIKSLKKGITLYNFRLKHGDEIGTKKFDEYRLKQSITNTFEYKQQKYGWTRDQFDEYNKSRAVTEENCIRRHGVEKGKDIYRKYCEKQRYVGVALDYFIDLYGQEEGTRIYEYCNKSKAHTLDNYIKRYGDDGVEKFEQYISNHSVTGYSKSSQEFFVALYNNYYQNKTNKIYFATHNKEFGILDTKSGTYRKYDFVDIDSKTIIEYNGDYYHANPKIYRPDDVISFHNGMKKTAKDIWKNDEEKYDLARQRGYQVIYVWESDCNDDMKSVIDRCVRFLEEVNNYACKRE
jgi:very-short-patch-repair endonuclease